MARQRYSVGLDVGSSCIRVVQAKTGENGQLQIVGAAEVPALGIRRGIIIDIEEAVSSITQALERLERMTAVPVARANVSASGSHVTAQLSHGVIAVSRADGEVGESDVVRVVDASQAIAIPSNREVLHVFPKTFTLDGQAGIKDPHGMTGIRLEVETIIVQAGAPFIKNLTKACLQAGLEVQELVLAPVAAAEAVLSKRQRELGVAVVDLGAGTTGLSVYEEGDLLHTAVVPVGGGHVTNDVAIGLRCAVETAEKVKVAFGHCDPKAVQRDEEVDLKAFDPNEEEATTRGYIADIIEARMEEIANLAMAELKKVGRDGKLPAGVVLTGGGAKLPGVAEFFKKHLRLPVTVGFPQTVETVIDRVQDPAFATAVGLVLWSERGEAAHRSGESIAGMFSGMFSGSFMQKAKRWFDSMLP